MPRTSPPTRLLAAVTICLLALQGCGGDGPGKAKAKATTGQAAETTPAPAAATADRVAAGSPQAGAIKRGLPSVVAVSVNAGGVTRNGSGTLLAGSTVVTDRALVSGSTGEAEAGVTVRESNGDEHPGVVDGIDPLSGLAAIHVTGLAAVPVAQAAPTAQIALGAPVVGLGYLSSRRAALRPGTIVTTGRAVRLGGDAEVGLFEASAGLGAQGFGGPVVDASGRVLGIATRGLASMVPGTVVALPIDSALRVARALADGGQVRRAYLGIETVGITGTRATELGLTTNSGVLLRSMVPGSPAAFSTLRRPTGTTDIGGRAIPTGGDAITQINGQKVIEPEDIDRAVAALKPGALVTLKVIRDETSTDVHIRLAEH